MGDLSDPNRTARATNRHRSIRLIHSYAVLAIFGARSGYSTSAGAVPWDTLVGVCEHVTGFLSKTESAVTAKTADKAKYPNSRLRAGHRNKYATKRSGSAAPCPEL
ncbi:hypothetical protein GcC1_219022 [Golovinomyces cichoracearum]|uniref:Uncharacterized protein n=1 Tax=Golovinomyces cichoracearum TaxID=62708 RepID=A0A420H888_9PEZI|nr:hypothetical protein GcC1_219022 [Golovinomyces cichoracearum]